jgi:transposase
MSYKSKIHIKESQAELFSLYTTTKNQRAKLKIKSLILFKKGEFKKQEDLANHLCIGHSTLRLWLRKYMQDGLGHFLQVVPRGKPKSSITPDIHEKLEQKLNNSKSPLKGYWHAVLWIKEELGVNIGYQALRNYMIKHFATIQY